MCHSFTIISRSFFEIKDPESTYCNLHEFLELKIRGNYKRVFINCPRSVLSFDQTLFTGFKM